MRIKQIKITGEIVGNKITISTISRKGMKLLLVMAYTSSGVHGKMDVRNHNHTDKRVAAKYIQEFLDGHNTAEQDIKEYRKLLEEMMCGMDIEQE